MAINQVQRLPLYKRYISPNLNTLIPAFIQTLAQVEKKRLLQPIVVLIPSHQWYTYLQKQIANNGNNQKICAGIEFEFPANFFWSITKKINPDFEFTAALTFEQLRWMIYEILIANNNQIVDNELSIWLQDANQLAIFDLAEKLAVCFNNYRLYQPRLLDKWTKGIYRRQNSFERFQYQIWHGVVELVLKYSNEYANPYDIINPLYQWIDPLFNQDHLQHNNYQERINRIYPNGIFWFGGIPLEQLSNQYSHALNALANATDVVEWLWQPTIDENINNPWAQDLLRVYETSNYEESYFNHNKQTKNLLIANSDNVDTLLSSIKQYWQSDDEKLENNSNNDQSLLIKKFTSVEEEVGFWGNYLVEQIHQKKYLADHISIYAPNINDYGGIINSIWRSLPKTLGFYWSKNSPFLSNLVKDFQKLIESDGSAQSFWNLINNPKVLASLEINQYFLEKIFNQLTKSWRVGLANDNNQIDDPKIRLYPDAQIGGFDIAFKKINKYINEIDDPEQKATLTSIQLIAHEVNQILNITQTPQSLKQWIDIWDRFLNIATNNSIKEWQQIKKSLCDKNSYLLNSSKTIEREIWFKILNQQIETHEQEFYQAQSGDSGSGIKIYPFLPDHIIPSKINIVMGLSATAYPKHIKKPIFYLEGDNNSNLRDSCFERSLALIQAILASDDVAAFSYVEGSSESPQMPSYVIGYLQEFLIGNKLRIPTSSLPTKVEESDFFLNHKTGIDQKSLKPEVKSPNNYHYLWHIEINDQVKTSDNFQSANKVFIPSQIIYGLSDPIKFFITNRLKYIKILIDQEYPQSPKDGGSNYELIKLWQNWLYEFGSQDSKDETLSSITQYTQQLSDEGNLPYDYVGKKVIEKLNRLNHQFLNLLKQHDLEINHLKVEKKSINFSTETLEFDFLTISNQNQQNEQIQLFILNNNHGRDLWQFWINHILINTVDQYTSWGLFYDHKKDILKLNTINSKDKTKAVACLTKLEKLYRSCQQRLVPFHPNICQAVYPKIKDQNLTNISDIPKTMWYLGIPYLEPDNNFNKIWQAGLEIPKVTTEALALIKDYWGELEEDING